VTARKRGQSLSGRRQCRGPGQKQAAAERKGEKRETPVQAPGHEALARIRGRRAFLAAHPEEMARIERKERPDPQDRHPGHPEGADLVAQADPSEAELAEHGHGRGVVALDLCQDHRASKLFQPLDPPPDEGGGEPAPLMVGVGHYPGNQAQDGCPKAVRGPAVRRRRQGRQRPRRRSLRPSSPRRWLASAERRGGRGAPEHPNPRLGSASDLRGRAARCPFSWRRRGASYVRA
jgi:hypothetical protein